MTLTQLERARTLDVPSRAAMLRRDAAVQRFWIDNRDLLRDAWTEWERERPERTDPLDCSLIDSELRTAVANAWQDPTTESAVRDLMTQAAADVYTFQLFDPAELSRLRACLDAAWDAGVPLRPPYGIVLNRRGAMLDPRSPGHLGAPSFQAFYRDLLDTYMRPISRLLFGDVMGYDTQTFGFSITYRPDTDTSIRPHSDASSVTLNVNLNLADEPFTGSEVDIVDTDTAGATSLTFTPGSALIHRGQVPHMAQPITSGQRTNLVLWLFGDGGRVPRGDAAPTAEPRARWTVPETPMDDYAPF